MAQSTTEHHAPATKQEPTPNVVQQGKPAAPATHTLDPVLAEGIDPVLLHRLYPEADSIADVSARALEQGRKTKAEGEKIIAAQQENPNAPPAAPVASGAKP